MTRTQIARDEVPRVSPLVRRRRAGGSIWLVRHNEYFELDAVADLVWAACVEGLSFEAIVRRLAAAQGFSLAEAIAASATTLESLRAHGLLEVGVEA